MRHTISNDTKNYKRIHRIEEKIRGMKKKLAVVLAAVLVLATVDIPVPVVRAAYETVGETTEAAVQTLEKTAEGTGEVYR